MKKYRRRLGDNNVTKFAYIFLGSLCVAYLFPLIMAVVVSFTKEESIMREGYKLIPSEFSIESYRILLTSYGQSLWKSMLLTITTGVLQPIISIFLIMCMAYPLSQSDFKGRDFWRIYILITMLFSGGLVPRYILYTRYFGLRNNILIYLLPTVGAWSVFLFRTFFVSIDKSMIESAKIDGAGKLQILFKIMVPLTKPLIVMNFFTNFLGRWNDITIPTYYISDRKLYTIQYLLQEMLRSEEETRMLIELGFAKNSDLMNIPVQSTRFALAVIGAMPALILFPYLQKFYAKGIMVGSTKG